MWQQSKLDLEKLLKQYECCFNNWKKSGNHGEFKEDGDNNKENNPLPFSDFAGNNGSLKYLHEFIYQFPNIFDKALGDLPNGAIWNSMDDKAQTC